MNIVIGCGCMMTTAGVIYHTCSPTHVHQWSTLFNYSYPTEYKQCDCGAIGEDGNK